MRLPGGQALPPAPTAPTIRAILLLFFLLLLLPICQYCCLSPPPTPPPPFSFFQEAPPTLPSPPAPPTPPAFPQLPGAPNRFPTVAAASPCLLAHSPPLAGMRHRSFHLRSVTTCPLLPISWPAPGPPAPAPAPGVGAGAGGCEGRCAPLQPWLSPTSLHQSIPGQEGGSQGQGECSRLLGAEGVSGDLRR